MPWRYVPPATAPPFTTPEPGVLAPTGQENLTTTRAGTGSLSPTASATVTRVPFAPHPTAPTVVQSVAVEPTTTATSVAATLGAAPAAGNLLLAIFGGRGGTGVTITPPTGWTQVARIDNSTTTFLAAYQKVAAAGDGSAYSFGLGATARYAHMVLAELHGQSPGTTVNVSATVLAAASLTPSTTAVTPTNTNVLYLAGFLSATTNGAGTPKAGWTELGDCANSTNTTTLEVQSMAEGTDLTSQSGQVTWGTSVATLTVIFAINPTAVNDDFSRYVIGLAGLQAYYRLDDTTTTCFNDTWGNNGGTVQNPSGVTPNQTGLLVGSGDTGAVLTSANDGFIAMPAALGPTGTNPFTWVVLCTPTDAGASTERIIGNDSWTSPGPNKGAALFLSSNGQVQAWRATDAIQVSSYIPNLIGNRHLLALTYDGLAMRLYCDGVCVFTNADTTSIATNGPFFCIGAAGSRGNPFGGSVDEVAILSTAVPGEAICDLYRLSVANVPAPSTQIAYGAYYNNNDGGWTVAPTTRWPAFVSKATNAGAAPNHVPKIANFFHDWANNTVLDTASCNAAVAAGAQPMVTWEAWNPSGGTGGNSADQPTYSLAHIVAGNFNGYIDTYAASVATWGKPIFVRLFHEFNDDIYPWSIQQQSGNNNQNDYGTVNSAALLVAAWQLVVGRCRAAGATNIRWVWCVNRHYGYAGNGSFDASSYPGDAYVDYISMDMYNDLFSGAWEYPYDSGGQAYNEITAISGKPVLIPEFGANPDADGGTAVAWINDFLGTTVPTYFPRVVAVVQQSDASTSHANWGIDATAGTLAAYQAQYASSLYGGAALLPTATTYTETLAAALSPTVAPGRVVGALRAAAESFVGSVRRTLARGAVASVGVGGQVARSAARGFSASVASGGARVMALAKARAATVANTAVTNRTLGRAISGALSFVGSRGQSVAKSRTAAVSPTAARASVLARPLAALAAVAGQSSRSLQRNWAAGVSTVGQAGRSVARVVGAALPFSGQRSQQLARVLSFAAQQTFSGALARNASRLLVLAAQETFAGARTRAVSRTLAASVAVGGALNTIRARTLSLVAGLVATGQRALSSSVGRAGSESPGASRVSAVGWLRAATEAPTGVVQAIRSKILDLVGTLSPAGARSDVATVLRSAGLATSGGRGAAANLLRTATDAATARLVKVRSWSAVAILSTSGARSRATTLLRSAAVSLVGGRAAAVSWLRTAALTPTGAVQAIRAKVMAFAGTLSPAGVRSAAVALPRAGALAMAGGRNRLVSLARSAAAGLSGAYQGIRARTLLFGATLAPAVGRALAVGNLRQAALTTAGTARRSVARSLAAGLAPVGGTVIGRAFVRAFSAIFQPSVSRQQTALDYRIGTFVPSATAVRASSRRFAAGTTPTAGESTARRVARSFVAAVVPAGAVSRGRSILYAARMSAGSALARSVAKSALATETFSAGSLLGRVRRLFLAAVVGLVGSVQEGTDAPVATLILWDVSPAVEIDWSVGPATTIEYDIEPVR